MAVLAVRTGDIVVRCREERFGCFIFDSRAVCAEGNKTIFRFVRGLSEGKKPGEIAREISAETGTSREVVYADIIRFLRVVHLVGWFREVLEEEQFVVPCQT